MPLNHYGLIGFPLSHSFSKGYFTEKFDREEINADYTHFELEDLDQLHHLISTHQLNGFNVTIPFKERIVSKLDWVSPLAKKIGAVNCVHVVNHKLHGYNTDVIGFEQSLLSFYKLNGPALVFGTGGASKAVGFVLQKLNIPFQLVSRNEILNGITYAELTQKILESHTLLINATPVGTYPDVESCLPITYKWIHETHFVYDLVYNPEKSKFLRFCEAEGASIKNGHEMLVLQAEQSYSIYSKKEFNPSIHLID